MTLLRHLYDWTMRQAEHPHALWILAVISFAESSVFPIPPDILMIPMILARPKNAWLIALIATVSSVLGGLLGYVIGAFFYDQIGAPLLETLGKTGATEAFNTRFNDLSFWPVLIAGLTPFPYKVITIMSGWAGMSLSTFIITSVVARGLRFFIVAAILRFAGPHAKEFIEQRLGLATTLFIVLLLGGFVLIKWM